MLFSRQCVYVPQVSVLEYFYVWQHKKKMSWNKFFCPIKLLQKVGDDGT